MTDLNRSLLSLVATLVILPATLFLTSAVVAGAQQRSILHFINLDPESGPLTFHGVVRYSGDTFELSEVAFGRWTTREFVSYAGIDATILDAEGNVYATLYPHTNSGVAVYGGGKVFGFDPIADGVMIAVSGIQDTASPRAVIRSPRGARDTVPLREGVGALYRSALDSEWTLHIDGRNHVDGRNECLTMQEVGRWPLLVVTADTIVVRSSAYGERGPIPTRTGHDSIEFRTVNATAETDLILKVNDGPAVQLSSMTVSAAQSRISTDGETRFLITDNAEVVLDTSFVVLPFQFLNFVVGHDADGELYVVVSERFTTPVAEKFVDYWGHQSRLLLFDSFVAALPDARRVCVKPRGMCVSVTNPPDWVNFNIGSATEALAFDERPANVFGKDEPRMIAKLDLRPFIGMRRTYIFDATLDGGHVYHYDEFDLAEQSLEHREFEADTFSVGVIAFGRRADPLAVEFDDSRESYSIPHGTTGITHANLARPPSPFDILRDNSREAEGEIAGTDGGRSILIVDHDFFSVAAVGFEALPGSAVHGIDLVNITENYSKLHVAYADRTINNGVDNGESSFGKIEDGDWGTYVVRNALNDTLATFTVDASNSRLIVIVDGSPHEKEIRVFVLTPEQVGTGEPLEPMTVVSLETTDVPVERAFQLDLSSEELQIEQLQDP